MPELSNMDLKHISSHSLMELQAITRQPHRSLMASLNVFLDNNSLNAVPGGLFQVKTITNLSLSGNKLTEVLPSIEQLVNLRELNLGDNQLRYVPREIGSLHKLKICTVWPNPLIRPVPSDPIPVLQQGYRILPKVTRSIVARTNVSFLDILGKPMPGWWPAPSQPGEYKIEPLKSGEIRVPKREERTKTPSLLELSLRSCYNASNTVQLPFKLKDTCQPHVSDLLKKTYWLKEAGGQTCSVCGSGYIIPRTEWVEWWYAYDSWPHIVLKHFCLRFPNGPIPALRRGCSWACSEEREDVVVKEWENSDS